MTDARRRIEGAIHHWEEAEVILSSPVRVRAAEGLQPAADAFSLRGHRAAFATAHYVLCGSQVYRDACYEVTWHAPRGKPLEIAGVRVLHCPGLEPHEIHVVTRFP